MKDHRVTDQEEFWKGEFGDDYIERNNDPKMIASNISLFSEVISRTGSLESVLERSEERRVGKECRSRWSPDQ